VKDFLIDLLGPEGVLGSPGDLAEYREDMTEAEGADPALVALVTRTDQVQAIVRRAARDSVPLTPRVAGTNVGGLAIPSPGGVVVDMTRMNRIVEVNADDMYAVVEPGVTQQDMKDHLAEHHPSLTLGYSLAPPYTSVLANAIMAGLTNKSLKYGDQSDWISGLEVVLPDGSLVRTGAWALSDVPFGDVPFPGLSGLFVGWQGTTGIVTRCAFQLWPLHPLRKRLFVLSYSVAGTYAAMRRLCRTEICDDIGGISWPSARMMMGVRRPAPEPCEGEPVFFLYVDLSAETGAEMEARERLLAVVLDEVRAGSAVFEDPMDVTDLLRIAPALSDFAEFPTELEFLTNHGGGGLSWIGTYGPLSRFVEAAEEGVRIMARHDTPPLIVSRPMRGGHFGVLRLITTFDKQEPRDVERVRRVNEELLSMMTAKGFVMYKTPRWAWRRMAPDMDEGMLALIRKIRGLLDPRGIMNPDNLPDD
jgi:glycolate oxidase